MTESHIYDFSWLRMRKQCAVWHNVGSGQHRRITALNVMVQNSGLLPQTTDMQVRLIGNSKRMCPSD